MALTPMQPPYRERELEFDFGPSAVYKLDADGNERTLPVADFAVFTGDRLLLVECKDVIASAIPAEHRREGARTLITSVPSGQFLKEHALPELFGSVARLELNRMLPDGLVDYVLLVECPGFDAALRDRLRDQIVGPIRRTGPPGPLCRARLGVRIVDSPGWNRRYPSMPVRRRSQA